jgi:hypothetical protein
MNAKMGSQSFKNLTVYKKAFELAMTIFNLSKAFPKEEKYSLTDQVRRSSRSVVVCIAEAYAKETTPLTLSVSLPMLTWRTVKLRCGWSLHFHANI